MTEYQREMTEYQKVDNKTEQLADEEEDDRVCSDDRVCADDWACGDDVFFNTPRFSCQRGA